MRTTILSTLISALCVAPLAPGAAQTSKPQPQILTYASAPSVISLYAVGAGIGSLIEKTVPGSRVTVVEGGTVSNVVRLIKNQVQIGYSKPATVLAAQKGVDKPFEKPSDEVVSVAGITSGPLHIAVEASSGIKTFDELVQKRSPLKISVGARGLSSEVFFRQILETYNLTYDDIKKWGGEVRLIGTNEGIDAMRNGQIAGIATPDILPHAGITQVAQSVKINLLSLSEEVIKKLSEKYGYARAVIPKGTYSGVDYDVVTLDDPYIIIARKELPEDFIYEVTKAFMNPEGRKYFAAIAAPIGTVDDKQAFEMLGQTKMHPGAEKYFREKGFSR